MKKINIKRLIDSAMNDALNLMPGTQITDKSFSNAALIISEAIDPQACAHIKHNLKNELEIMRGFVGSIMIAYHANLRKILLEQGIDIGCLRDE